MLAEGRRYQVEIVITYMGGWISRDALDALTSALRASLGRAAASAHVGVTVSGDQRSALNVRVAIREFTPIKALARLDTAFDQALLTAGLFEQFDVAGKTLFATPYQDRWNPPPRGLTDDRRA